MTLYLTFPRQIHFGGIIIIIEALFQKANKTKCLFTSPLIHFPVTHLNKETRFCPPPLLPHYYLQFEVLTFLLLLLGPRTLSMVYYFVDSSLPCLTLPQPWTLLFRHSTTNSLYLQTFEHRQELPTYLLTLDCLDIDSEFLVSTHPVTDGWSLYSYYITPALYLLYYYYPFIALLLP